ncbi:MAG TPA: hypothetical protein VF188_14850 [Longimicrobiales bacterium]
MNPVAPGTERADASTPGSLLRSLERRIPVQMIDEVWIFPTRRAGASESTVIVVSAFDAADADRRRVLTAQYTARRDRRGNTEVDETVTEHGRAPPDRIGRLIDGVVRRLDPEFDDAPPRAVRIAGDADRWMELVGEREA